MENTLNERFARNFKEMRLATGLSQEDFAKTYNMDRSFVSHIERGSRNSTLKTVDKVAAFYGIDSVLLLQDQLPREAITAAENSSQKTDKNK